LKVYGISAAPPDSFILDQIDRDPDLVLRALNNQKISLKNPVYTWEEFFDILIIQGLQESVMRLRAMIPNSMK
jgi:hypothetical protein